jgi:hypothetical protein
MRPDHDAPSPGDPLPLKGFFTQALFLRGQSGAELERRLGYSSGTLAAGWSLLFLDETLTADDILLRGYTHFSGGVPQGHLETPPDPRTAEKRLADEGYDLARIKARLVNEVLATEGPRRVAKVLSRRKAASYPVGSGVPQWELKNPKRFRVKAVIEAGAVYAGDYA